MSFVSDLGNCPVIDDSNWRQLAPPQDVVIDGEVKTRGLLPRDYSVHPLGATGFTAPFDVPNIPRSEWPARIEELERTKSRLSDIADAADHKCLDQNGTNYCWANGPVYCVELVRLAQGLPLVYLSPASVAGPIKGYRNVGGWGTEALEYIVQHGIVPVEMWPPNSRDSSLHTAEAKQRALDFKVTEWYDLRSRDFDQLMTCLLLRIPVAVGYNWWGHEVAAIDPVVISSGKFGVKIRNSWGMGYGDRGYAVLAEGKATPDDAVAPRVIVPSAK